MKILVIVSCFAPKNIIGAVRTSKLVKYFIREGNEVTVISPSIEEYDKIDLTLECAELDKVNRITVPYSKITTTLTKRHKQSGSGNNSEIGNQIDQTIKAKLYRLFRNSFSNYRDYEWKRKVKKIIRTLGDYDLVFSSYPYLSAHDCALFAKKRKVAKKWIADFRDPIVLESVTGREHNKQVKRQSDIIHYADKVIYVTKQGAENFVCYKEDKSKIYWVPNGFDQDDFSHINTSERVNDAEKIVFSYAGGMYKGERDCSPLFAAIRNLINKHSLNENQVCVEYAGPDYAVINRQAANFNLSSILLDHGKISRAESLSLQKNSDCVIVATFCYKDGEGAMPGKVYEPIMLGKPILMLVSGSGRGCEAAAFIERIGAGCSYEDSTDKSDTSRIENMILSMLAEKKEKGSITSKVQTAQLEDYRYPNIARKVLALVEGEE